MLKAEGMGRKKWAAGNCRPRISSYLGNGRRFAEMLFFHGHSPASLAHIFHGFDFLTAHVLGIHLGSATKAAFCFVSTRIAQVPRVISNSAAILARISHRITPF